MAKISTPLLKTLMQQWLNDYTDKVIKSIENIPIQDREEEDIFNKDEFCDISKWKRTSKSKVKDEWQNYIIEEKEWIGESYPKKCVSKGVFHFRNCYAAGGSDQKLLNYYGANPLLAEKCILRHFEAPEEFASNFDIDILTTPDDDQIVGWVLNED